MNPISKHNVVNTIPKCDKEKIEEKVNDWIKCVKVYQSIKETKQKSQR